ncbi:unnamed protein product [Effrenium voratum]|nr:unnamed protein product [Effrenium voratum]
MCSHAAPMPWTILVLLSAGWNSTVTAPPEVVTSEGDSDDLGFVILTILCVSLLLCAFGGVAYVYAASRRTSRQVAVPQPPDAWTEAASKPSLASLPAPMPKLPPDVVHKLACGLPVKLRLSAVVSGCIEVSPRVTGTWGLSVKAMAFCAAAGRISDPEEDLRKSESARQTVQGEAVCAGADAVSGFGLHLGDLLLIPETDVHWGDAVNTASKLGQDIATDQNILISAAVQQAIREPNGLGLEMEPLTVSRSNVSFQCFRISRPPPEPLEAAGEPAWPDKRYPAMAYVRCTLKKKQGSDFCGNHSKRAFGKVKEESLQEESKGAILPKEVGAQLAPYLTLDVAPVYMDMDMYYVPFPTEELGRLSAFWGTTASPTLKVYSGRPQHLQLFSQPLAIFLEVPALKQAQAWKAELCASLYNQGVEIPLPTSSPFQNFWNGSSVVKRALKVTAVQAIAALRTVGVTQVWVAQFGGKVPLEVWRETFAKVLIRPMTYPTAFDLGLASPDPLHLCVFGLESGSAVLDIFGKSLHAYIHPLFPGMVHTGEAMVWGTLELKESGPMGSEIGKFLQAYSPISHLIKANENYTLSPPATMKSLRGRKAGLVALVDTILCNLSKAGGARIEVRCMCKDGALTVQQTIQAGQDTIEELCEFMAAAQTPLMMRRIPLTFYRDFIKAELAGAVAPSLACGTVALAAQSRSSQAGRRPSSTSRSGPRGPDSAGRGGGNWNDLVASPQVLLDRFAQGVERGRSWFDFAAKEAPRPLVCPEAKEDHAVAGKDDHHEAERCAEEQEAPEAPAGDVAETAQGSFKARQDFWGRKAAGYAGQQSDLKSRISRREAEAMLQRLTSNSKDLDEVRRLRKLVDSRREDPT